MEIDSLIKKMKAINSALLSFIESTDDIDAEYKTLIDVFEKQEILKNKDEVRLLFQLISKIADNHHRASDFLDKLEKIFQYLIKDVPSTIAYYIPDYQKYNKRILFLLLEKEFVKPDDQFLKEYLQSEKNHAYYYLYLQLKKYLDEEIQKQIEEEISQKYKEEISIFEEKCQKGENDSYICSLIRSDSIEEFVSYVNRTNLSLTTKIKPSIYETNPFLINKEPTLIEYASFFGSIQIIQYLKYNNVPLTSSLWVYTVHSNNAELIHFLEENAVKPEDVIIDPLISCLFYERPFDKAIIESIKCHHNEITNYIKENLYNQIFLSEQKYFYDKFNFYVIDSLNFFFIPNDIESLICQPNDRRGFNLCQLCFFITKITIPSSVTEIGEYAFCQCKSLTQIIIPSSVTSIGNDAFFECSSLTQITIPSSVKKFGYNIFFGMKSLEIIGDIKHIPDYFLSGCSSLTQITIPSSVTSIGDNAFFGCSSLTQVTIPSSVTKIGESAFFGCSLLSTETIELINSIKSS